MRNKYFYLISVLFLLFVFSVSFFQKDEYIFPLYELKITTLILMVISIFGVFLKKQKIYVVVMWFNAIAFSIIQMVLIVFVSIENKFYERLFFEFLYPVFLIYFFNFVNVRNSD